MLVVLVGEGGTEPQIIRDARSHIYSHLALASQRSQTGLKTGIVGLGSKDWGSLVLKVQRN